MGRKTGGRMQPGQLMLALQERYPAREYAFLQEVSNATGASSRRHADAVALSLWPSRGLVLHGFELKNYRGDWIREKTNPQKADEVAKFCDFWHLVVSHESIVQPGELPATWGLLAPNAEGTALVTVKAAEKMEAQPWTRGFMAAVLRRAGDSMVPRSALEAQVAKAELVGFERGKGSSPANESERELKRLRELEERVRVFEQASGLHIQYGWNQSEKIGDAVNAVLNARATHQRFVDAVRVAAARLVPEIEREYEELKRTAEGTKHALQGHLAELERLLPTKAEEEAPV